MKKTYDLIFGLGPACSCSQTLRKAGLQLLSFPFDWIIYTKDLLLHPGDLPRKADDICAGMGKWFEREDISYAFRAADGQFVAYNRRTTSIFPHDFYSAEELDQDFEKVKAKYERRISRLLELIRQSKDVLIVRLDAPPGEPPTPDDDCRYARRKMAETFAGTNFDLVHFRCEKNRSFKDRTDREIEPGFREIAFDYHDDSPGKPFYEVRLDQTARALRVHAAVRDYRTLVMKKTRYDLVFGMGSSCSCSQTIRAARLQFESFPYDWVAHVPLEKDLEGRLKAIEGDFVHWFDKEDLSFVENYDYGWHARAKYHNRRTGGIFYHDFNVGEDFDAAYPAVLAKYRRRIDCLYRRIRASRRVLAFRLDFVGQKPQTSIEECVRARQRLMAKFPGVSFDWLLMAHDASFSMDDPKDELIAEGIRRVAFDYHSEDPRAPSYQPDFVKTAAVLSRYVSAVDYRTFAEKRKFWIARQRAHWAKHGATTFWGYLRAKLTGKGKK